MNDTALSIALATGITILAFWIIFGLLLFVLWRLAKRHAKRIEAYFRQPTFGTYDPNLVKPRGNLTKDEYKQVRDLLRARKEQEARDLNTIDTATEFNRED